MKKYFIYLVFGLLLYGCSELTDPAAVNQEKSGSTSGYKFDRNGQNTGFILLKDSSRSGIMSDSVIPPNRIIMLSDSVIPPNGNRPMSDSVIPPNGPWPKSLLPIK